MYSVEQQLQHAAGALRTGNLKQCTAFCQEILRFRRTTGYQRYRALKLLSEALDRQFEWHRAETVFAQGLRQLQYETARARSRQQHVLSAGFGLLLGFGLAALVVAPKRRSIAA